MTSDQLRAEVARTRLPERIVRDLLAAGLEVPTLDRVDRVGYDAVEVRAFRRVQDDFPSTTNPPEEQGYDPFASQVVREGNA
jgi:hypothetical protein